MIASNRHPAVAVRAARASDFPLLLIARRTHEAAIAQAAHMDATTIFRH
jgi:hypothetical protein